MQIRHFRRFRQNGPFLAGDKNTVYQKHGLCDPDVRAAEPAEVYCELLVKFDLEFQISDRMNSGA